MRFVRSRDHRPEQTSSERGGDRHGSARWARDASRGAERAAALAPWLVVTCLAAVGCGRSALDLYDDGGGRPDRGGALDGGTRDGEVPDGAPSDVRDDRPDLPDAGECTSDDQCSDGLFCNGVERCLSGICQPGELAACDDGVGCTVDTCSEAERGCTALPNSALCLDQEICDPLRGCVVIPCSRNADCDDGVVCNGPEVCPASGFCRSSAPLDCNDGIACTIDECSERLGGCVSTGVDRRCDDGSFCNGAEACLADIGCVSSPAPACFDDGDFCTIERCDEVARACVVELLDGDFDGWPAASCGGTDCNDADPRVNPGSPELCGNGVDDDCNGGIDCADPVCAATDACRCQRAETRCSDLRDDDCDGLVDCRDPDCAGSTTCSVCDVSETSCADGRDNDCDGRLDCADSDCLMVPGCRCAATETGCRDGVDNDCDGRLDCADPDCASARECVVCDRFESSCEDRRDNDCDGLLDCDDPECAMNPRCIPPCARTETQCFDGRDDDCDGFVDCGDPECRVFPACQGCRPFEVSCSNGNDDDCDGLLDCADPECGGDPICCVGRPEQCGNGADDDCNGLVDCEDPSCAMTPGCFTPCPGVDLGTRVGRSVAVGTTISGANRFSPTCAPDGSPEQTFSWRAPADGRYVFDTLGSSYDTVLYAIDGCSSGFEVACNDDNPAAGDTSSILTFRVAAGEAITLVMDGYAGDAGRFVLNVTRFAVSEVGLCRDGVDNDGDGRTDCADADCVRDIACGAVDGGVDAGPIDAGRDAGPIDAGRDAGPIDAGRDAGPIDAGRDAGPSDAGRDAGPLDAGRDAMMCTAGEIGIASCTNGSDDDCDGRRDCDDTDCSPFGPLGGFSECCDGTDDNGDGLVDIFTCRCNSNADCAGVGNLDQVCWTDLYDVCAPRCDRLGGDIFCRQFDASLRCVLRGARQGQCTNR